MAGAKDLITLAAVGIGGYFVYEYIIAPMLATTAAPPATPPPKTLDTTPPAPTPTPGPGCNPVGALAKILPLAQAGNPNLKLGPAGTDTLNIDQWDYYANQWCTGYADQIGLNADTIFPNDPNRGGPLNYNAFAGYATQKGLSGPIGSHIVMRRRVAA